MPNYIGIDIGGTHTRLALSNSLEKPELKDKIIFHTLADFEHELIKITEYIDSKISVDGIGIGIAGTLNENKSFLTSDTRLKNYLNKPLAKLLSKKYNCKTQMDNDAASAGLGEGYVNKNTEDFIYIIWGTGVGGALVKFTNGNPTSTKIDRNAYLKSWENSFGGQNLKNKFKKSPENLSDSEWETVFTDLEDAILANKELLLTKRIIFGGGISIKQQEKLKNMADKLSTTFPSLPKMEISKLGEDAGLIGAMQLLR